jgi:hypothetical protein
MVPHPEALSAVRRDHSNSAQEVLPEAQKLLLQVLGMLSDPIGEKHANNTLPFRLARGHLLTLLDHLARMMESRRPTK